MYLEQLITSAFQKFNPQTYGVINVQPEGKDWFVIAEQASMNPVFETGDCKEAIARAHALAQAKDLDFWAGWMENEKTCELFYQGALLTQSTDGLPLIPQSIVDSSLEVEERTLPPPEDAIPGEYNALHYWGNFATAMGLHGNTSFVACIEIPEDHPAAKDDSNVWVLVSKVRSHDMPDPSTIRIEVLNPNQQVFGKESLYDILWEHRASQTHSWVLDGPDDFADEEGYHFKYLKRECPLYLEHHDPATQRAHVFIHEGGKIMEALAKTRPWMVAKDKQGNPLPLRISPISGLLDEPTEEGADKQTRFLSSIAIHDKLTACAREAVIAQQAKGGITREQVMSDGRQFKHVATIRDLDVEVMFDKTAPNVIGTREYLNYRIWVQGELVMDVHPDNPVQYNARRLSLSPMGGELQDDVTAISDSQCGELIATALSELSADEGSPDLLLPERVKAFLRSSYADEIQGDANALEEGQAHLVKGVFQEIEDSAVASDPNDFQP